ncbi:ATP-binding protein [Paraburkholderia metrosideri]|uniref:ATP-binding protein n=1 Tax=Paraburkholderia metrosideri TaxID=580937 RepID=A0ABW9E519_9BURK
MADIDFSGTTEISDEGIKKHFKNIEPWGALFELTWNGLDANASTVEVSIVENQLGGVENIMVLDNGDGVDFENIKENFGRFNDSPKKENAAQHGLHGRGRLAFHRLCNQATWNTKSAKGSARITVESSNIKHYSGTKIDAKSTHNSLKKFQAGTCVELTGFHQNLPLTEKLKEFFSMEFGWHLALNPQHRVCINGTSVLVPEHEIHQEKFDISDNSFDINIIRWNSKPNSEKSFIYLLNSSGKPVHKQLSSFNHKTNFHVSIYIKSAWADTFIAGGASLFSEKSKTVDSEVWRKLSKYVGDFVQRVYDDFLRRFVEQEIAKYIEEGIFPAYNGIEPEHAKWRMENAKSIVKAVYTADPTVFNSLNKKQKKVIVRLLDRIAVSNENDALFEILNSVLDLGEESTKMLAEQLQKTELENIVSTIEIIQQRQAAVQKIRALMNDHYKTVKETPDLQKIIECNTWLFGHRYETIGAEEDTFTKIAKSLRDKVKNIKDIEEEDVSDGADVAGANRQTDLFLARKIVTHDSFGKQFYRCIIIEIKRPSVSLNVKHLRQLDDYADIVKRHPEFSSELMHFELILIGRRISAADTEIDSRMRGQIAKGEMGLVSDDPRMKRYVLNWYTVLDSFEVSNDFLLKKLKTRRDSFSDLSKDDLVRDLQTVTD